MSRSTPRSWIRRGIPVLLALVVAAVAIVVARGAFRRPVPAAALSLETVERRDITVTVEATGTVEPINLVEVKSKASGQIIRMPVEIGSVVRPGQLLAQIDSVDVRNQYDQADAALRAAEAKSEVSAAQKKRADQLYAQQILTAEEHEAAMLDEANARSGLVSARTNLEIARQRLADATVRAPIAGTILAKPVSVGQVISSATSSVSGGTTLLQMADLRRIRIRALVSEADIGSVRAGQPATVLVDAFPQRQFQGEVEKIEPQSVVQQSVTMFPVLVSISNEDGRLLPGMNGEVTVLVQQRENVPAVSLDAVRSVREISAVAVALGLDADSLTAQVRARLAERSAGRGAQGGVSAGGGRRSAGSGRGTGDSTGRGASSGGASGMSPSGRNGSGRQAQVVFVQTDAGLEPRIVRLGVSNFDYAEVLDGVKEGDRVALLSVAELQAKRTENLSRLRERMSSTMPGVGGSTGRSGTGRGGP